MRIPPAATVAGMAGAGRIQLSVMVAGFSRLYGRRGDAERGTPASPSRPLSGDTVTVSQPGESGKI
jgi:hypothetical protein